MKFIIGTYTIGSSQGIYQAELDETTGEITQLELIAELDNPTFLTLHPNKPLLLACSEIRRDGKREGAKLVAYHIQADGHLQMIDSQPTQGSGPCYVSIDQSGQVALVAHYASGSVLSIPIAEDGSLSPISQLNQHLSVGQASSLSPNPSSPPQVPHAHCIVPDPSNRFACAVDLGLDQVRTYALDSSSGSITSTPVHIYHARPGSGPRHLTFHPNGQTAFLIHELNNTLSALAWDAVSGTFTELDTVSTLPEEFVGTSSTAEVLVHPNGRFVYGSNRGHDSLVVFQFSETNQRLDCLQHISCGGRTPRNFRIDPSGRFLLAANQDSDSIVVFQIDSNSGRLTASGYSIEVGNPSCVKFVEGHGV